VRHIKQISGELRIMFVQSVKIYWSIFIYYQKECTYVPQVIF